MRPFSTGVLSVLAVTFGASIAEVDAQGTRAWVDPPADLEFRPIIPEARTVGNDQQETGRVGADAPQAKVEPEASYVAEPRQSTEGAKVNAPKEVSARKKVRLSGSTRQRARLGRAGSWELTRQNNGDTYR